MSSHAESITWGHWYWPLALILASLVLAGLFFPAEIYAIFSNKSNTLSDFSRYELGLTTAFGAQTRLHTISWWTSQVVWLGFVTWITGHIWYVIWG